MAAATQRDVDAAAMRRLAVEVGCVAAIVLGLFTLLSLLSYGGLDPDGLPVRGGWTGPAGKYLAFALYQILGHGALLVPPAAVLGAVVCLAGRGGAFHPLRILGVLACLVLASSLLHVGWAGESVRGGHDAGGFVGALVGDRMTALFAGPGTFLLLGAGLLTLMVLVSGIGPRAFVAVLSDIAWQGGRRGVGLAARGARGVKALVVRLRPRDGGEAGEPQEPEEPEEPELTAEAVDPEDPVIHRGAPQPDRATEVGEPAEIVRTPARDKRDKEKLIDKVTVEEGEFELPGFDLLVKPPPDESDVSNEELRAMGEMLREALEDYGVRGAVREIREGPVVTMFEFVPEKGTKISSISRLSDDLAMSLKATKVRIVAPIPGKNAVGFELPSPKRRTVYLGEVMSDPKFAGGKARMPIAVGKDIVGNPFVMDLARMPHLLVAGTTGSGKSVAINTLLTSLLYTYTPRDLRLILVDPKTVELQPYDGIPHLLLPVVTDMKHASSALRWAVDEMEKRYQMFSNLKARDIVSFNRKVEKLAEEGRLEEASAEGEPEIEHLPFIVIVIDEFADLMMTSARDVEAAVARLAAKARAAGIHLVVATQRPSVNVVTGTIKANFPCRIAFKVTSKQDSRVMLDMNGAESLLGKGDMLLIPPGESELVRVHGAFVSDEEIRLVTEALREQSGPTYREEEILRSTEDEAILDVPGEAVDEYYDQAVALVTSERKASISWLQRKLSIGYQRSARIIEHMEAEGIVGPAAPGKGQREVLAQPPPPI